MSCINSLAVASSASTMVANAVIELCPGTYPVGTPFDDTFTTFAGGVPLIVDQSGVTVKCGADGKQSNGCIFEGGWSQILTSTGSDNLNISGITFTGVMESALSGQFAPRVVYGVGISSQVTFTDCKFENINTTGYLIDFRPTSGTTKVKITNTAFENVTHSFDAISANEFTQIQFDTVTFENMAHILPEDGVEKCVNVTAATCNYASSIIHVGSTSYPTTLLNDSYIDVSVTNSEFYTSIVRTLGDWGPKVATPNNFTTLVSSINNTIYNQTNRTANDDYCEGGYAAAYNSTTLIDWTCKRTDYALVPITEILRCGYNCDANGNFSTVLGLLSSSGLDAQIAGNQNNVTIFAPTNAAFGQLPPGFIESLSTAELQQLLLYHVTSTLAVDIAAIRSGLPAAATFATEAVSFRGNTTLAGFCKVDNANIIQEDWEESPGAGKIIQVTDRVLYPSTLPILPSFSQLVEDLNLTQFISVAADVGFDPNVQSNGTYTLFAPSNAAIQASTATQALITADDKTAIIEVLNHHFVTGNYSIADLQAGGCQTIESLAVKNVKIDGGSNLLWNDAISNSSNSSLVDQLAYNGILHVIEGVLDPSDIKSCVSGAASIGSVAMSMAVGLVGTIVAMWVV